MKTPKFPQLPDKTMVFYEYSMSRDWTVAYLFHGNEPVSFGISKRFRKDVPHPKLGRLIALRRALYAWSPESDHRPSREMPLDYRAAARHHGYCISWYGRFALDEKDGVKGVAFPEMRERAGEQWAEWQEKKRAALEAK